MKFLRFGWLAPCAVIALALAAPQGRAQGAMDQLTGQLKQKAMEQMQQHTGAPVPGQPAAGTEQPAPVPTTATDGGGGANKVLVWGDPQGGVFYREGEAGYGTSQGGRCMIEKQAKESGLHHTGDKKVKQGN